MYDFVARMTYLLPTAPTATTYYLQPRYLKLSYHHKHAHADTRLLARIHPPTMLAVARTSAIISEKQGAGTEGSRLVEM